MTVGPSIRRGMLGSSYLPASSDALRKRRWQSVSIASALEVRANRQARDTLTGSI